MTPRILVTLGPSSLSKDVVKRCADQDVYVFRINLSHTPLKEVAPTIDMIRQWTDTPICLDSEGAQMRNQNMKNDTVSLSRGSEIKIHFRPVTGDLTNISFAPRGIAQQLRIGDEINVDFNLAKLRVEQILGDHCVATVIHSGEVGSNKAADVDTIEINDAIIGNKFIYGFMMDLSYPPQ